MNERGRHSFSRRLLSIIITSITHEKNDTAIRQDAQNDENENEGLVKN